MLLLDIDADFMLSEDACNRRAHTGNDTRVQVSGRRLAEIIELLISPRTRLIPVVDHQESLYVWDVMRVRNAKCIHIDAHHDCWVRDHGTRTRGGRDVSCGNYLAQALYDRIVRCVTFVPAMFRAIEEQRVDVVEELMYTSISPRRMSVQPWRQFIQQVKTIRQKASIITICVSPEWFPKRFAYAFDELCRRLKIKRDLIDETLGRADKKWEYIRQKGIEGGMSVEQLDFTFPYTSRRSLRGKRLTELASSVRKNSQVRG